MDVDEPEPRAPTASSIAGLLVLALLMVECGGGGGSGPAPTAPTATAPTATPTAPTATAPTATTTATTAPATAATPLVASVRWVTLDGRPSLEVTPTPTLRAAPSRAAGKAAWSEVVRAEPAANTAGMEDQFLCHVQFAAAKPVFHLEPWRPAVGYLRTVVAACNPGAPDADLQR